MKKYESIMKRVRRVEEKYGINYAKVGGKLFKGVTVVAAIAWIYMFLMNLMFILSMSLALSIGQADFSFIGNAFVTVCAGSWRSSFYGARLCKSFKGFAWLFGLQALFLLAPQRASAYIGNYAYLAYSYSRSREG